MYSKLMHDSLKHEPQQGLSLSSSLPVTDPYIGDEKDSRLQGYEENTANKEEGTKNGSHCKVEDWAN
jgi:hypothetical protein